MSLRPKRVFKNTAFGLVAIVLGLCVLEGLCSFALLGWDLATKATPAIAERKHTEHDEELGWVGLPGVAIENLYGDGRHLHTNAQGFRGRDDTPKAVPDGEARIICSGDSFTFGYGVADADTWPARLAALHPKLDVVNMGQGGYGVDQSYLWYVREHGRLDHHVHLFAFIDNDFERMRSGRFFGYDKPLARLRGDDLEVTGTPVPEPSALVPWLYRNGRLLERLGLWRAWGGVVGRVGPADDKTVAVAEVKVIAGKMFADMGKRAASGGADLVLVYLPTLRDCREIRPAPWRTFATAESRRQSLPLVDLTDGFRAVPQEELDSLFIGRGEIEMAGAAGHYTAKGNALAAQLLYGALLEIPSVAARLR